MCISNVICDIDICISNEKIIEIIFILVGLMKLGYLMKLYFMLQIDFLIHV